MGVAARPPTLLLLAVVGWGGVAWLGARMLATAPPTAGFDLDLLLGAGRRIAAGLSPYAPAMLEGRPPTAEDLFYSYPPPAAQVFSLGGGVPLGVALLALAVVAVGGLALVAWLAARRLDRGRPARRAVLAVLAVAPFLFPFVVAILFGNLDATFPLLFGLLALAALRPSGGPGITGGVALAIAAVKLYPAPLGAWFLVRGFRAGDRSWRVLAVAVAAGLGIVGASLLVGGPDPWRDYLVVLRTGASADLVDRRNIGPAAQLAALLGGGEALARSLQVAVSLTAQAAIAVAARRVRDPLESLAFAATATLVTLPVTWFHYAAALLPFGIMALLRARAEGRSGHVGRPLGVAALVSAVSIVLPAALWVAVAALLVAVHRSRPAVSGQDSASAAPVSPARP